MWLGSYQQLKHVDIDDIPILSMQVKIAETVRDLRVVLDSQLSLTSHVAALCRAGFFHLRQLRPAVRSMTIDNHRRQNSSWTTATPCCKWHVRRPFAEGSVHSDRRRTSGHRSSTMRPYHAGVASAALAACPSTSHLYLQFYYNIF